MVENVLAQSPALEAPWQNSTLSPIERAAALLAEMTLEEKLGQLVGLWVGADESGGEVAPNMDDMTKDLPTFADAITHGLGQLTRPFGTAPVSAKAGARSLAQSQRAIVAANRFGIPAQVHEECLAGFAAWGATAYPVPLAWGASWNPELVEIMAAEIARSMRAVGVHQGLAPVLDVVRDYRWGRTEEAISEDPLLVGILGSAYVHGIEGEGLVATLKHFAGYSGSRAGRNHAPVPVGWRELADVFYPPFEMALRRGGARSVMNSYSEVDGVPAAADVDRLTHLLRETWGFSGVVVADYFAIAFLRTMHEVAQTDGEAAVLALTAGIDVELPSVSTYGAPLTEAVSSGAVDEALVDRAVLRVLAQKAEIGLLDADYEPERPDVIELDTAQQRNTALQLARESIVLLTNNGALPLAPSAKLAVIGPLADDPFAMLGCYSFPAHVGVHHPEVPVGIDIPTVVESLRAITQGSITHAAGCEVKEPGRQGFAEAIDAASSADVAIVVVGDRAGLFGRGTSGEGCDAEDLTLPGEQAALVEAVLESGTPVVLVVLSGRPYALGQFADRTSAIIQGFFPGQLGGQAVAEVLTGAVNPSGRLPVGIPRRPGSGPGTYLAPPLGAPNGVSNLDPSALFPFGHGIGYSELVWAQAHASSAEWDTQSNVHVSMDLRNDTDAELADVVQVYLHRTGAQVTRPVRQLIAFHRVVVPARTTRTVEFTLHADLTSFTGLTQRVVQPGPVELLVARSSANVHTRLPIRLSGAERGVSFDRVMVAQVEVRQVSS